MSTVIAIASLKGGVGKTTIATNLGACFSAAGIRTILVDLDIQQSAVGWGRVGTAAGHKIPKVIQLNAEGLDAELPRLKRDADVIVIDAPPRLEAETKEAMMDAELVLLPVLPGAFDVWALSETVAVLAKARELKPTLRAYVIPNRLDHTTMSELMSKSLPKLGVPILGAGLGSRVAFREAALAGAGICEYAPGTPAALEMSSLYRAVVKAAGRN